MASPTLSEGKKSGVDVQLDKPNWLKVEGDDFKVDHVIHAYLSGKETALTDLAKTVERQQKEVLAEGMGYVDRLLEKMQSDLEVDFVEARLKQVDLFNIESIIILDSETYFSEKIDAVYELYFSFEEESDIDFNMEVKFTFDSENLNKEQLLLDGFEYFRNES